MKVIALDVSTKTGWAIFHDGQPISWGTVFPDKTVKDFGQYPQNYVLLAEYLVEQVMSKLFGDDGDHSLLRNPPFEVVIEETNAGRQNYSQKMLEFLHFVLIKRLAALGVTPKYIRSGEWRGATESKMTKEEKSLNAKIGRIKKKTGKKLAKIDGKVVGKKGKKHVAIRRVGEIFGIELKRKDEDAADALLLGLGYINGAPACDGTTKGGKSKNKVKNG